jgi:hypothetical protein
VIYEREIALAAPADAAWRALSALPPARGSAAGYEGVAVVEDADDDARVATLRLVGTSGAATVAATAAVTVLEGRLRVLAELRHGPGGLPVDEAAADDALGHLATTLAYALATASRPRRSWDTAVPPTPGGKQTWDRPSPPPGHPARAAIPADATLRSTIAPAESGPLAAAEPPRAALPAAPVSTEVVTPREHDVLVPGQGPSEVEHRRPWAGVAAAAWLAVLRMLRGRR